MEKNRHVNQSLAKGQSTDSKKPDTSIRWPRHSKRREQPNCSSTKPENLRNGNKSSSASKTRFQTNYNYDKRSKQRTEGSINFPLDATDLLLAPTVNTDEHEGTRLVNLEGGRSRPENHELHSVFSPGSKKQSLNHLLNFHYAPREREQPIHFTKTGNYRAYVKKPSYNKEQFLQANCQFVVSAHNDYATLLETPDKLVDWARIEQIHVLSSEEPQCPICLYPPVAAKMTKCGHVYCWPCILHYLALSDKTWRKCPICYDAIHIADLRSTISKPFHPYASGENVSFQLMRRLKTSMRVVQASEKETPLTNIPRYDSNNENSILSKLLTADATAVLNIINREKQELQNQVVMDGVDCPENIFVQQALDQLAEREQGIQSRKHGSEISTSSCSQLQSEYLIPNNEIKEKKPVDSMENVVEHVNSTDYMIDEDSNFLLSDIDIIPTAACASSDYYYFYQSIDGQPLYLHSLNNRMLQTMYGSLDKSPQIINGKIVQKDSCSMSEDLRKKLKYLQHLPVCTQFEVVEIEFEAGVISSEVETQFKDELNYRRKNRKKRARAERIRERQIYEFNERQLGKSLERSARIPINSTKHFPMCGSSQNFRYNPDTASEAASVCDLSSSPGVATAGPSWSKMLSTSDSSRWPTLPSGSSGNVFGPLSTTPPKLVQITGSKMKINAMPGRRRSSESDYDECDVLEEARVPEFRNDLCFAIEAALEKATLNSEVSAFEGTSDKQKSSTNSNIQSGSKKKKNKKTLLFTSGMNLNN